ncbi:MAG: hypothetical protein HGGPFJEG_02277 [Ignavibacteria bacterium]|nr:hypothetical protein [Ignavibacteria bacterium]
MKGAIQIVVGLLVTVFTLNRALPQVPTYTLCVRNITHISINYPNDAIVFDVYLLNTNPSTEFKLAGGQFYHSFNRNIFNPPPPYPPVGNDSTYISYKILDSELPTIWQLRNHSFLIATNPSADVLAIGKTFPNVIIDTVYPGTLIAKMRIWNKLGSMNNVPLNLQWRNPPIVSFATKIFAVVNNFLRDITTPTTHCIESITNIRTENDIPAKFILYQNYPNPFNPVTIIAFTIPRVAQTNSLCYVRLSVYDVTGKEVTRLVDEYRNVGYYKVEWDGSEFGSGIYLYKLENENGGNKFSDTKRMMMLK